jgi:hypothetical protein
MQVDLPHRREVFRYLSNANAGLGDWTTSSFGLVLTIGGVLATIAMATAGDW